MPAKCGQVDFFEVTVEEDGVAHRVWKFLLHLPYSGRSFVWLYDRCDQVAFLRRPRAGVRALRRRAAASGLRQAECGGAVGGWAASVS